MKKLCVGIIVVFIGLVFSVSTAYSELLKEGSGDYRSVKSSKNETLAMGKERLQVNLSQLGVVVDAPPNSPFENATFKGLGTLHAIKGQFEVSAFVEWTRPNGDKIYATSKGKGTLGRDLKSEVVIVGGTGTCEGIQGTLEIGFGPKVMSSDKELKQMISVGKVSWKLP
jgi:hypothetical protein